MAVRKEDLTWQGSAVVCRFPPVRARRQARIEIVRRRIALGAVAAVVVVAGLFATGPQGVAPAAPRDREAVVLKAGDTLWGVAAEYAPANVDTRAYLDAILELNQIGVVADPGTRIRLP